MRRTSLTPIVILAALALSACSAESNGPAKGSGAGNSSAASTCTPASLKTQTAGTLTIATDSPAYDPWFSADKPSNGKGFESAVAFAVAKQLGYPPAQVTWVVAAFKTVIAPTPKRFDFDINQVSITPERAKVVDFSTGYYDVAQAVITLKGSKIAGVTTIPGLRGAKLGAQKGTTSLATALYIAAAELDNGQVVGQLPVTGNPEQFGLVLDKGSSLTSCVSKAVDALRRNGTLAALQKQWLTSSAGAPELK
jgi:polar amino acid transport system substrate-binding protein